MILLVAPKKQNFDIGVYKTADLYNRNNTQNYLFGMCFLRSMPVTVFVASLLPHRPPPSI